MFCDPLLDLPAYIYLQNIKHEIYEIHCLNILHSSWVLINVHIISLAVKSGIPIPFEVFW